MKRLRHILAASVLVLGFGLAIATPVAVHADTPKSIVCNSIGGGSDCSSNANGGTSINKVITVTITILSFVAGIAAVIMLILAGFNYITSGGDANKVSSAKNSLIYAIIGIIIVAMAQFIVQFILAKAT